jgi:hypothetical protein
VRYGDADHRGDAGFLSDIKRVVDQLLDDDQQPIIRLVAGLGDQLLTRTKFKQAAGGEGLPRESERAHDAAPGPVSCSRGGRKARAILFATQLLQEQACFSLSGGLVARTLLARNTR